MPGAALTDDEVKRLPSPPARSCVVYDTMAKGFGACITTDGTRSFILTYRRKADGRQRYYTIGSFPDWRTTAARAEAQRLKRAIDAGVDPLGELEQNRAAATMRDLATRFLSDYVPRKRASTQRDYKRQIEVNILPGIGGLKVASVSFADIDALHQTISKRAPTQANRTVAVLSRMFSLAIRWHMRADNPCRGIERNQEHKRRRYPSSAELTRLSTALAALSDQGAANAIRLLLPTGARRGEVLAARWSDFDLDTGVWAKPGATTKQKTDVAVFRSKNALAGRLE